MRKFLVGLFTAVLAFSAFSFSACDLLPNVSGGGNQIEKPEGGDEIQKPNVDYGHKEHLLEGLPSHWEQIQELDKQNNPSKLTSEHYETFERWMSELRALEWTEEEDEKDPNKEQVSEYQKRLDEIEQGCNQFLYETERLVRGGFYVTCEVIPYKIEEEKSNEEIFKDLTANQDMNSQQNGVQNTDGQENENQSDDNKGKYITISHWSKTPVTYQEILTQTYSENTIEYCTYWDRYVSKLNGVEIGAEYTFTESAHVICYENEPDFYITIEETNLNNETSTYEHEYWGEFTFWQWMKNGSDRDDPRIWHEYCRDMGQRPVICDGKLMQPDDVINSSCTFVITEKASFYDIDIVAEIRGETREIGEGRLYYSHSLYEAAIYDDLHVYELSDSLEHQIYYYLDWFDIYFNGKKIENYEIREYMVQESGTLTLKGRDRYEVGFKIEVQTQEGEIKTYGPYTVVAETQELYQPAKSEIHLESFLRNEFGEEEYNQIFSGLVFYLDDYTVDYIEHSCKIVAKQPVSSGGSEEQMPDDEEWQRIREEEENQLRSEWETLNELVFTASDSALEGLFEKIIDCVRSAHSWDEFDKLRARFEVLKEQAQLYDELNRDWNEHIVPTYSPDAGAIEEFRELMFSITNSEFNSMEEIQEIREGRYEILRQRVMQNSNGSQNQPTEPETPANPTPTPTVPDGFPESLSLSKYTLYSYPERQYLGTLSEDGKIVNEETGEHVGFYELIVNAMGEVTLDESGRASYLVTLSIEGKSYTYTVKSKYF
ncbi:MAG: hypothetical protein IKA72_03955 [Clostridia bacterium]|nr:hypothetical protein [Clostridia bacterium]